MDKKLRVQVFGAHPDDCDLSCGAIALQLARAGHAVQFVSITNGGAGHQDLGGAKLVATRKAEAASVAAFAGISYIVMDNDDAYLQADTATREKVVRAMREFKPDLIISPRPFDYHPDHRNAGTLVQDASYLVMVPNFCKDVPPLRYQPIITYMYDHFTKPLPFQADVVVDTTDVYEDHMVMLTKHVSQFFEWLPWVDGYLDQVPPADDPEGRLALVHEHYGVRSKKIADQYREELIARYGKERGEKVQHCAAFEICEYGGELKKEDIDKYFPF